MSTPPTIKGARAAGSRELKPWEYGSEQIIVKGRVFARDPKEAYSKTEWSRRGYSVLADVKPHCERRFAKRKTGTYPIYRDDQVAAKRKLNSKPAVVIDILAAVWVINCRTKRCRDLASVHHIARITPSS